MPQRPPDAGDTLAILTAFYGYKAWEVDLLTDEQIQMYLDRLGTVRFMRDLPMNLYRLSKMDDESIEKALRGDSSPDERDKQARRQVMYERMCLEPYGMLATDEVEARPAELPLEGIDPATAEGIIRWIESGSMMALPDGATIWRQHLWPVHHRMVATAALYVDGR